VNLHKKPCSVKKARAKREKGGAWSKKSQGSEMNAGGGPTVTEKTSKRFGGTPKIVWNERYLKAHRETGEGGGEKSIPES